MDRVCDVCYLLSGGFTSKTSFIVENGCGLECVPKRSKAKLYFTSFQNERIGKILILSGRTVVPVPGTFYCMTTASEREIREAALNAGAIYLEIWRLGEKL